MALSFLNTWTSLSHWAYAIGLFVLVLTGLFLIRSIVALQLKRLGAIHGLGFLEYLRQILDATRVSFLIAIAALAGLMQLELTPIYEKWGRYAAVVIFVLQAALWANRALSVWLDRAFESHKAVNPSGVTHLLVVGLLLRILLWSLAMLMILDNLGFNITTLVASLGIGGVAVALAVQNILGDLFSSVSIALDKPFVIGDFIVINEYMGTVEYVGLKTTRLRSLGGEQIIISNTELLKRQIRNYKRMEERRISFEFSISYDTPYHLIEKIPAMVSSIVKSTSDLTRFDRAHFRNYSESALQFEVVYYVLTPDFNKYMDIQQEINLAILREFRRHGVNFAFPTRTLYLAQQMFGEKRNVA